MSLPLALASFPDCHGCASFRDGPASACLACARRSVPPPGPDACPRCAQHQEPGRSCASDLCGSAGRRIGRIQAIGYQSGPLRRCINSYKYRGTRTWSVIFGRLLLAWLDENMAGDRPDLIVTNPGFVSPRSPVPGHAEAVLAAAAAADAREPASGGADSRESASGGARPRGTPPWPFDTATPAAIIKTRPTPKSADAQAWAKRASGSELRSALAVPEPGRTSGKFILVYDDVCTTGTQLDAVAGCLLDQGGAARVEGIVLARALWRGRRDC